MNFNKLTNVYSIRATEVSSFVRCQRNPIMKLKQVLDGTLVEESSEEAELGTSIHKVIENIILDKPIPSMNKEVKDLVTSEIICDDYLERKVYVVDPESTDMFSFHKLGSRQEYISYIRSTLGLDAREDLLDPCKIRVYAPDSNLTGNVPCTLYDTIRKDMFGNPLVRAEESINYIIKHKGYTFEITGKVDSVSLDDNLIVDWKTSSRKPTDSCRNSSYFIQQGVYRNILYKTKGGSLDDSNAILGYIVKTIIPKFMPVAFSLQESYINEINFLIYNLLNVVVNFIDYGTVPMYSMNEYCDWCSSKSLCYALNPTRQNIVDVRGMLLKYKLKNTPIVETPKVATIVDIPSGATIVEPPSSTTIVETPSSGLGATSIMEPPSSSLDSTI
jgi:hypothetical protein